MKPKRNSLLMVLSHPDRYPLQYFWLNFIVITPAIGLAVNGFSGILFEKICSKLNGILGLSKAWWQVTFSILCVSLVVLLAINIKQQFQRLKTIFSDEPELDTSVSPLKETFRGLIAIASNYSSMFESPAEVAIHHHWKQGRLEHCWLICSQDAMRTIDKVIDSLEKKGVPLKAWTLDFRKPLSESNPKLKKSNLLKTHLKLYLIQTELKPMKIGPDADQAHNPNYIREMVDLIYHDASYEWDLPETDIVADYTGGTKSMTAGIVLACLHPNRKIQYIWSELNEDKMPKRSEFWEVKMSYKIKPVRSR